MNWPCRESANRSVFIKNAFVERWHFRGVSLQTQAMIDAYWSGVLHLDICIFALLEYSAYYRRLFVYQNQYSLYLNNTPSFPHLLSIGSNLPCNVGTKLQQFETVDDETES